jgi:RNA polymerase sigma factor (sigma-70 family)
MVSNVPKPDETDLLLWQRFREGDESAFALIFDRFSPTLYRYGSSITVHKDIVEDSIQDGFVDIWRTKERLSDTDNIGFYLFKVVRRKIYKNLQSKQSQSEDSLEDLWGNTLATIENSIETNLINHESETQRRLAIANVIVQLPPRQREVIELRFYQGFSYEQIAEIMGINLQSVHNNVHRALTFLRGHLTDDLWALLLTYWGLSAEYAA